MSLKKTIKNLPGYNRDKDKDVVQKHIGMMLMKLTTKKKISGEERFSLKPEYTA